jgi:hypothetical protein
MRQEVIGWSREAFYALRLSPRCSACAVGQKVPPRMLFLGVQPRSEMEGLE